MFFSIIHSRKLTWKPKKGPIKTTVRLKGESMGFPVSLGECNSPNAVMVGVAKPATAIAPLISG